MYSSKHLERAVFLLVFYQIHVVVFHFSDLFTDNFLHDIASTIIDVAANTKVLATAAGMPSRKNNKRGAVATVTKTADNECDAIITAPNDSADKRVNGDAASPTNSADDARATNDTARSGSTDKRVNDDVAGPTGDAGDAGDAGAANDTAAAAGKLYKGDGNAKPNKVYKCMTFRYIDL